MMDPHEALALALKRGEHHMKDEGRDHWSMTDWFVAYDAYSELTEGDSERRHIAT